MKKIFIFLFGIFFCTLAIANNITLNWDIDNQTYTTTTCTVGGDVELPTPPTKRGYIFRGWQAEHFDRGTFADWTNVPTNPSLYREDHHGNRMPLYNDSMVVTDAGGVPSQISGSIVVSKPTANHKIIINDVAVVGNYTLDSVTYTVTNTNGGNSIVLTANKGVIYNNVIIKAGSPIVSTSYYGIVNPTNLYYSTLNDLSGTWRFIYDGIWENDGQLGWKQDYQISNE